MQNMIWTSTLPDAKLIRRDIRTDKEGRQYVLYRNLKGYVHPVPNSSAYAIDYLESKKDAE